MNKAKGKHQENLTVWKKRFENFYILTFGFWNFPKTVTQLIANYEDEWLQDKMEGRKKYEEILKKEK